MTYQQVAELFGKFEKASTWSTSANPERFYFWVSGRRGHDVAHLSKDDGKVRYLWVPLDEVRDHVEATGQTDAYNVYYRLKKG